jgi:hypothetical protein
MWPSSILLIDSKTNGAFVASVTLRDFIVIRYSRSVLKEGFGVGKDWSSKGNNVGYPLVAIASRT